MDLNLGTENFPAVILALAFGLLIIGIGAWAITALNSNHSSDIDSLWEETDGYIYILKQHQIQY